MKRVDLGNRPTFYVVIIYEDSKAGRRAKHFYDRVIQELEDECDFSLELWSFQVLALPGIGNAAARASAKGRAVTMKSLGDAIVLREACKQTFQRWLAVAKISQRENSNDKSQKHRSRKSAVFMEYMRINLFLLLYD